MRTKIFKETRCGYFDLLVVKGTERFNGKRFFPFLWRYLKIGTSGKALIFHQNALSTQRGRNPKLFSSAYWWRAWNGRLKNRPFFFVLSLSSCFFWFCPLFDFCPLHDMRIVPSDSFSPLGGLCEHPNIIIPVISRNFSDYINVSFQKIRRSAENLFRFCAEDFTRQALSSNKWLPAWCARLKTSLALKLRRSFEITSLLRKPRT